MPSCEKPSLHAYASAASSLCCENPYMSAFVSKDLQGPLPRMDEELIGLVQLGGAVWR